MSKSEDGGFFRLSIVLSCIVWLLSLGPLVGLTGRVYYHWDNLILVNIVLALLCGVAAWVIYNYVKWIISKYQSKLGVLCFQPLLNKRKGLLGLATILSILAAEAGWIYGEFNDNYTFVFVGVIATWIAYVIARWVIPFLVDQCIVPAMKWVIAGFELDREAMKLKMSGKETFDIEKAMEGADFK